MQHSKSNLIAFSLFSALVVVGIYGYANLDTSRPNLANLTTSESTQAAEEPSQSIETTILASTVANQDGATVTTTGNPFWIGNGTSKNSSYLGLRFSSIDVNPIKIQNASLEITPSVTTSQPLNAVVYAEKSESITVFSNQNPISTAELTTESVDLKYTTQWKQNQKITIGGLGNIVKEVLEATDTDEINIIIVGKGNSNQKRPIFGSSGVSDVAPKLTIISN